jgi:beta-galactosidase
VDRVANPSGTREAEAGPLWMQPQVTGSPREDGRIPDENDVRLWNMVSCAGGASGILYPRWRPHRVK